MKHTRILIPIVFLCFDKHKSLKAIISDFGNNWSLYIEMHWEFITPLRRIQSIYCYLTTLIIMMKYALN